MKNKIKKENLDQMQKDPDNWFGKLYFNRKDPRFIVRKIYSHKLGYGWTFNFANPLTYVFLVLLSAIIFASKYLLQ